MSKSTTDTKKKLEHWELVTLLLMVYSMLYLVCWVEELLTRTGRPVLLVN